jgi:hypothetical protein
MHGTGGNKDPKQQMASTDTCINRPCRCLGDSLLSDGMVLIFGGLYSCSERAEDVYRIVSDFLKVPLDEVSHSNIIPSLSQQCNWHCNCQHARCQPTFASPFGETLRHTFQPQRCPFL